MENRADIQNKQDAAYAFAEYAAGLKYENIPETAVNMTKQDIFDSLSTALAGSSVQGIREMMKVADGWGGNPQATCFVFGKKYPANVAGMINTVMIHGYDFDDTHDTAMMHSGCMIVSAALAAAEKEGTVSGRDLIAAVTAGLDIHCRIATAATVVITESGWVYTPTFGIFGAVAAAGRVMGLNAEQMLNAFGIAYAQAAGNYQAITDSAMTKRMQPGFATRAAILSCELAKEGIVGAHNVFEGKYGIFHVYLNDRYTPETLTKDLGQVFAHEEMAFKPWPCGRPSQPPITVALEAREKYHPDPAQIERVKLYMNQHIYNASCVPKEKRNYPKTVVDCQFSIPYGVACALTYGKVGLSDFTEAGLARKDVLDLTARIEGIVDPEIEAAYHAQVCPLKVVIQIHMKDGSVYEHTTDIVLGHKKKPMTEQDFDNKMKDCLQMCALDMAADTPARIRTLVDGLERLEDSCELIRAMVAGEQA